MENIIQSYNSLLSNSKDYISAEDATIILENMEQLGRKTKIPVEKTVITFRKGSIVLEIHRNKRSDIVFTSSNEDYEISNSEQIMKDASKETKHMLIKIPASALEFIDEDTNIYFFNFFDTSLFQSKQNAESHVLGATVGNKTLKNLTDLVELNFIIKETVNVEDTVNLTCAYWKPQLGATPFLLDYCAKEFIVKLFLSY